MVAFNNYVSTKEAINSELIQRMVHTQTAEHKRYICLVLGIHAGCNVLLKCLQASHAFSTKTSAIWLDTQIMQALTTPLCKGYVHAVIDPRKRPRNPKAQQHCILLSRGGVGLNLLAKLEQG